MDLASRIACISHVWIGTAWRCVPSPSRCKRGEADAEQSRGEEDGGRRTRRQERERRQGRGEEAETRRRRRRRDRHGGADRAEERRQRRGGRGEAQRRRRRRRKREGGRSTRLPAFEASSQALSPSIIDSTYLSDTCSTIPSASYRARPTEHFSRSLATLCLRLDTNNSCPFLWTSVISIKWLSL
eukprot:2380668-Rhodomonas_salina.4